LFSINWIKSPAYNKSQKKNTVNQAKKARTVNPTIIKPSNQTKHGRIQEVHRERNPIS
jgi:hypothetical protein